MSSQPPPLHPQPSEVPAQPGRRRGSHHQRRLLLALVLGISFVVLALILVQIVAVPLWTAAPDTVRVTVTHTVARTNAPDSVTTIYDRTMHDPTLARRLQRDLAALPTVPPDAPVSCPLPYPYDTYTLTWSRAGLFVEWASTDTPGCTLWNDVTLIYHQSTHSPMSDTIFVDLHAAMGVPLPLCAEPHDPNCRLPAETG